MVGGKEELQETTEKQAEGRELGKHTYRDPRLVDPIRAYQRRMSTKHNETRTNEGQRNDWVGERGRGKGFRREEKVGVGDYVACLQRARSGNGRSVAGEEGRRQKQEEEEEEEEEERAGTKRGHQFENRRRPWAPTTSGGSVDPVEVRRYINVYDSERAGMYSRRNTRFLAASSPSRRSKERRCSRTWSENARCAWNSEREDALILLLLSPSSLSYR
ncbi:hypothetical protein KM043_017206 [Ampulex compressa]|nr:hypothetical protein KM043_017206 [Ampulex compressa]